MGQASSHHTISTRASKRSSRSTNLNYPRQYTGSDDVVGSTNDVLGSRHQRTPHRSDGHGIKYSSRPLRNTTRNAAPATVRGEQFDEQKKYTTPDRRYYHDEVGSTRGRSVEASRSPNSNSRSQPSRSGLHRQRSKQTKECVICTDNRSLSRFSPHPPTAQCSHNADVCRRCLRTWIRTAFASKIWDEINCPICSKRLTYEDVRRFAPSDVFRKYDKLSAKAALESIPGFRWCIMKGCRSGQVHEEASDRFRCVGCKQSHCIKHNVAWHKGESCKQYDYRTNKKIRKEEERASKRLMQEIAKICPGCKRPIEKSYGCDHMTCTKCKQEFCWQCLAPYQKKKGHTSVTHRAECIYFAEDVQRAGAVVWDEGVVLDR
ncbi:hypothetical protein EKO04_002967 [Ascochyta lentis]|uniref:RBR-type E3 ubiquitin transferase n=1 Tax=Ascochyta lentis TaxID=205686 RepID=A0A8H7J6D5_9PLEO|nr:hypothetical protein EKO04_002967 [Ascochyta lentis]